MKKYYNLERNSYASGKVGSLRRTLYKDNVKSFLDMEFDEILRYLEEHGFKYSVDKSYLLYDGFYLVESILNNHSSRIYDKVFRSLRGDSKKFLQNFYMKYQIHNFMVLLRAKSAGEEEIQPYLIGDERRKEKYIKALSMPKTEDSITYISKKLGFDPQQVLEIYRNNDLFTLENYLYKYFYEGLVASHIKFNYYSEKKFTTLYRWYIDLLNARTMLKLNSLGNEVERISFSDLFIKGGNFSISFFEQRKEKPQESLVSDLKKSVGEDVTEGETEGIDEELLKFKSYLTKSLQHSVFNSPFYVLRFLLEMEEDMGRLRTILKGKFMNMEREELEKLV